MALIFEFRKKLSVNKKPLPVSETGTGSIIFFTGVRYERIAPTDVTAVSKGAVSRKREGQRRSRPIEALA